jgi:hypothetical protein
VDVSGGYQFKRSADKLKVTLGSLVVGKPCSLFLKLTFKEGLDGSELTIPVAVHARGEDNIDVEGKAALTFKRAPASEVDVLEPDKSLMERFVQVDLADKATEALKRERKGDRVGASRIMSDSVRLYSPYVSSEESEKYTYMSQQMSMGLDESSRKRMHQQAYTDKRGRDMTYDYRVRLVNGVLIAEIEGRSVVVGTGSPISAGEPTEWFFLDQVHQLSQDAVGVTPDNLSGNISTHIDILLGMDIMKKFYVTVDLNANRISFSRVSPVGGMVDRHFNYERIPLTNLMGTPICQINIAGQEIEVFVDTGAKLTYLDRKLVQNITPVGREKDFFYSVGEFETPVYKLPLKIGGIELVLRCGEMPKIMETTVLVTGKRGILGTEIFDRYAGCFAFPDDELILFT